MWHFHWRKHLCTSFEYSHVNLYGPHNVIQTMNKVRRGLRHSLTIVQLIREQTEDNVTNVDTYLFPNCVCVWLQSICFRLLSKMLHHVKNYIAFT